ncbi:hypothetical protein RJ641_018760 [Dillenia turbinata]|uniref:Uncharacterized protein n=1 Tax=Dillenia turbinata TaxID=194707 RepID=A0AAN8YUS9_9MAGN
MKATFGSHGLWDVVKKGYDEATDESALTIAQLDLLQKAKKGDQNLNPVRSTGQRVAAPSGVQQALSGN